MAGQGWAPRSPPGGGGPRQSPHPQGRTFAPTSSHPHKSPHHWGLMPSLGGLPEVPPGHPSPPRCASPALCPQDSVSPPPATLAPCLRLPPLQGLLAGTRVPSCPRGVLPSCHAHSPSAAYGPWTSRAKVLLLGLRLGRCPGWLSKWVLCPDKGIQTGRAREVGREGGAEPPQGTCAHSCLSLLRA